MFAGCALVAMFVVPRHACHQLLRFGAVFFPCLQFEVFCVVASQCRCKAPAVEEFDLTVFPYPVREPEIMCWRLTVHFAALRIVKEVTCAGLLIRPRQPHHGAPDPGHEECTPHLSLWPAGSPLRPGVKEGPGAVRAAAAEGIKSVCFP